VRVAAFVSGGFVPAHRRGVLASGFVHLCDWYATLSSLAGIDPTDDARDSLGRALPPIDSLDMWPYLSGAVDASPRNEVPLTVGGHQPGCGGGLIVGRHKILFGTQSPAIWPGPQYPNGTRPAPISVSCGARGCLFDIFADPTEHDDLASSRQGEPPVEALLANLTARFNALAKTAYQTPWVRTSMDCDAPRVRKMLASGFWAPYTDAHAPDATPGEQLSLGCPSP
jgi:arylsulfatase I/J